MTTFQLKSEIEKHLSELKACNRCPLMVGPVVTPRPVVSKVYLVGQAPGPREGEMGRPFAWTAGRRMFSWFETIGLNEEQFRSRAYLSAVCRCFPGKAKGGGDRVPAPEEIKQCSAWMQRELDLLEPQLVIPVGRLAIEQFIPGKAPLADLIGQQFRGSAFGHSFDLIPLPIRLALRPGFTESQARPSRPTLCSFSLSTLPGKTCSSRCSQLYFAGMTLTVSIFLSSAVASRAT